MSDKTLFLIVAFASLLCVVWALFVPSAGMAIALLLNAFLSFRLAFKLDKSTK